MPVNYWLMHLSAALISIAAAKEAFFTLESPLRSGVSPGPGGIGHLLAEVAFLFFFLFYLLGFHRRSADFNQCGLVPGARNKNDTVAWPKTRSDCAWDRMACSES